MSTVYEDPKGEMRNSVEPQSVSNQNSAQDNEESKNQAKKDEETDTAQYMTPAVNYLSHEPNFLFRESSQDQENRIR